MIPAPTEPEVHPHLPCLMGHFFSDSWNLSLPSVFLLASPPAKYQSADPAPLRLALTPHSPPACPFSCGRGCCPFTFFLISFI